MGIRKIFGGGFPGGTSSAKPRRVDAPDLSSHPGWATTEKYHLKDGTEYQVVKTKNGTYEFYADGKWWEVPREQAASVSIEAAMNEGAGEQVILPNGEPLWKEVTAGQNGQSPSVKYFYADPTTETSMYVQRAESGWTYKNGKPVPTAEKQGSGDYPEEVGSDFKAFRVMAKAALDYGPILVVVGFFAFLGPGFLGGHLDDVSKCVQWIYQTPLLLTIPCFLGYASLHTKSSHKAARWCAFLFFLLLGFYLLKPALPVSFLQVACEIF